MKTTGYVALTPGEAATLGAMFDRMWPAATDLGVLDYLDRALDGRDRDDLGLYRRGLPLLDRAAEEHCGGRFRDCTPAEQDRLLADLERGALARFVSPRQELLFATLRRHLIEGLFSDPAYGGNRDGAGWAALGYPGVHLAYGADGKPASPALRTLADHEADLDEAPEEPPPGFDPQRGAAPPAADCDVVVVGAGGVGGLAASWLALAGMRVVALEAGPWRPLASFKPDELGLAFYARAGLGEKFAAESPRWRRSVEDETEPMPYSLGRMCNGVGGSLMHYGARLRRLHPHHFRMRSVLREQGLLQRLPADCTVADWPLGYADLEPHYAALEQAVGVAGPADHPFLPRSTPLPMPPTRIPAVGARFAAAAARAGLHPQAIPVGQNTTVYHGRPAMTYSPWGEGLGSPTADRWMPTQDLIPQALASGNLDLRTQCRVLRILVGPDGRASGVAYVDADGRLREQKAGRVVISAYTFETVRLLMVSGIGGAQLGRHFMTKQYPSVFGSHPGQRFDRHSGPGAQGVLVEDHLAEAALDKGACIGGGTLSTENQLLPIQLAREPLPPGTPSFGEAWKAHLEGWNERMAVRIQTDSLSYAGNHLDLDPLHRDRSGYGLPLVRVTYAIRENERRLYDWMMERAEALQQAMGAAQVWRGPWFTGIGSCHDFGGCRMGEDPAASVVGPDLQLHDVPGVYVMGGAVFPTCHGVNPTLTLWALARRAVEGMV